MGSTCSASKNNEFRVNCLPYLINATAYIWCDNGHNLFDYESENLVKKSIDFDFQGRVVLIDKDVVAVTKNEYIRNQKELLTVKCLPKQAEICSHSDEGFWKVIRPAQSSDLPTTERQKVSLNGIIRLGRVQLTVIDFNFAYEFDDGVPEEMQDDQLNNSDLIEGGINCRVCFSKLALVDNPFISPCKCSGSVKFIHLKCLQSWINSTMKMKTQNGVSLYYWKSMKCELCKTTYKTIYRFKSLVYNLCNISKPKEPYLILQINHSDKNKEQGLYIIELKNRNSIKIGRTQDCDIKMHDISVSRHHASIIVNHAEQSFYVEDNCSKFGTLVQASAEDLQLVLNSSKRVALQVGRVVIVLSIDKKNNNKKFTKYRVPHQFEVFRQIKFEDEDEVQQVEIPDVEDILINDPNFDYELEFKSGKNYNFLTGSIIQKDANSIVQRDGNSSVIQQG